MLKKTGFLGMMLIVSLLAVFTGCEKGKVKLTSEESKIAAMLPETTKIMVKFASMNEFFNTFSIENEKIMGGEISDLDKTIEKLGFNPFDLKELSNTGLETNGEFGFVLNDLVLSGNIDELPGAFFFPVKDIKTLENKVIEIYKKNNDNTDVKIERQNGVSSTIVDPDGTKLFWGTKDGYVFLSAGKNNNDYLVSLLNNQSKKLKDNKKFTNTLKNVSMDKSVYVYLDMENLLNKESLEKLQQYSKQPVQPNMNKLLDLYKAYEGMAFSLDLTKSDFISDFVLDLKKDSELKKIFGSDINRNVLHGMKKNPLLLLTMTFNTNAYYKLLVENLLSEQMAEFKQQMGMIKQQFGIDVEKDIIENLAGNFGLGLYDGGSINMLNYNSMLTLDLKDPKKFEDVFGKLLNLMPPSQRQMISEVQIGNVKAYVMNQGMVQIYAGVSGNDLIIALGKAMFEDAIAKDGNALKNIENSVTKTMQNSSSYFFVSFDELLKAYNNFAPMLQAFTQNAASQNAIEEVSKLDYLYAYSTYEENSITGKFIVKTKFTEPFLKAIAKVVKESQQKNQN